MSEKFFLKDKDVRTYVRTFLLQEQAKRAWPVHNNGCWGLGRNEQKTALGHKQFSRQKRLLEQPCV